MKANGCADPNCLDRNCTLPEHGASLAIVNKPKRQPKAPDDPVAQALNELVRFMASGRGRLSMRAMSVEIEFSEGVEPAPDSGKKR